MAPCRLLPLIVAMTIASGTSQAADEPVPLKQSTSLTLAPPENTPRGAPIFIDADRIASQPDGSVLAEGQVSARTLGKSFQSDWLRYAPQTDEVFAGGNIVFQQGDSRLESDEMRLRLSDYIGEFQPARYAFPTGSVVRRSDPREAGPSGPNLTGRGDATKLLLQGRDLYRLESST